MMNSTPTTVFIGGILIFFILTSNADEPTNVQAVSPAPSSVIRIVNLGKRNLHGLKYAAVKEEPFMISVHSKSIMAGESVLYASADKKFVAGVAQYERVTLKLTNWPLDELMVILEGQVEITDTEGRGRIYKPGDVFLMPKGFSGTWRQLGELKKIAVGYSQP